MYTLPRWTSRAASIALAAGIAASAGAQGGGGSYGFVTGSVRDSTGKPIAEVAINVPGHLIVRSDSAGNFRLPAARGTRHQVAFRRLGFEAHQATADLRRDSLVTLAVVMTALPQDLPDILVEASSRRMQALQGFYDRKRAGWGTFLMREDFEQRHPMYVSDIFRMIPGARVMTARTGRNVVRFERSMAGRDCPPQIYVDGIMAKGMEIDELVPSDIEAMEVYQGASSIPPQFNSRWGTSACGVIVVWTRVPGT